MRLYDPATKCFIFRGESFDIQALVDGLQDIATRARKRWYVEIDPWRRRRAGRAGLHSK